MSHGLRQGAVDSVAAGETVPKGSRLVMAFEDKGLEHVLAGIAEQLAIGHGHGHMALDVAHAAWNRLDNTDEGGGAGKGFAVRIYRGDTEGFRRDLSTQVHGVENPFRIDRALDLEEGAAVFSHHVAVDQGHLHVKVHKAAHQHHVRAPARGDAAKLVVHVEASGRVDGHHLQGDNGVDALLHGAAQDVVQVAVLDQRVGVRVVRDEVHVPRVDGARSDRRRQVRQVAPCRTFAQLRVLAQAHLGEHVFRAGRFMVAAHAACHIGVEATVGFGNGVMAGDAFVRPKRRGDLAQGVLGSRQNAGEVHHLAQAHHRVPGHGLFNVIGAYRGTRILKTGNRRHARGRGHHSLERGAARVLDHNLDAVEADHVGHLVRVPIDAHRAVGNDRSRVLGGAHHR